MLRGFPCIHPSIHSFHRNAGLRSTKLSLVNECTTLLLKNRLKWTEACFPEGLGAGPLNSAALQVHSARASPSGCTPERLSRLGSLTGSSEVASQHRHPSENHFIVVYFKSWTLAAFPGSGFIEILELCCPYTSHWPDTAAVERLRCV